MNQVIRGCLATAAGAFIGSVIASQLGFHWWFGGLIIGMLTGGISGLYPV